MKRTFLRDNSSKGVLTKLATAQFILLDLDGTLVNTLPCLRRSYFDFLDSHGSTGSETEFEELNGPPLESIVSTLANRHNLSGKVSDLVKSYIGLIESNYIGSPPLPGADKLLSELQRTKRRTALVTSSSKRLVKAVLDHRGWDTIFEAVVTGDCTSEHKPSPVPYLIAIDMLGGDRVNALGVEDSSNGVRSVKRAGITCLAIGPHTMHKHLLQAGADCVFETLEDFCTLIEQARHENSIYPQQR